MPRTSTGCPAPASSSGDGPPVQGQPDGRDDDEVHGPDVPRLSARHPNLLAHPGPRSAAAIARAISASEPGATQHQSSRLLSLSAKCLSVGM